MYHPITIANYFIVRSFEQADDLTPMKLLKLVYIAHGWYLGAIEKPFISEEVEAWKYGPVIVSLYRSTKKYEGEQVTDLIGIDNIDPLLDTNKDEYEIKFLDEIWKYYRGYDGLELLNLTCLDDSPWHQTVIRGKTIISDDLIISHYRDKLPDDIQTSSLVKELRSKQQARD